MAKAGRTRQRHGFTPAGLIITLAVLGLLLAAAIPEGGNRAEAATAAARDVSARIASARRRAVTEGVPYLLVWRDGGAETVLVRDVDQDLVPDPDEPREGPVPLPVGVTVTNHAEDPFSACVIALRPTGTAHEAGTLSLRSADGARVRISVTPAGARCTVTAE